MRNKKEQSVDKINIPQKKQPKIHKGIKKYGIIYTQFVRYFLLIALKFCEINHMKSNKIIGFDDGHHVNKK